MLLDGGCVAWDSSTGVCAGPTSANGTRAGGGWVFDNDKGVCDRKPANASRRAPRLTNLGPQRCLPSAPPGLSTTSQPLPLEVKSNALLAYLAPTSSTALARTSVPMVRRCLQMVSVAHVSPTKHERECLLTLTDDDSMRLELRDLLGYDSERLHSLHHLCQSTPERNLHRRTKLSDRLLPIACDIEQRNRHVSCLSPRLRDVRTKRFRHVPHLPSESTGPRRDVLQAHVLVFGIFRPSQISLYNLRLVMRDLLWGWIVAMHVVSWLRDDARAR